MSVQPNLNMHGILCIVITTYGGKQDFVHCRFKIYTNKIMKDQFRRPSFVSCLSFLLIFSILFTIYELISQFWSPVSRTNLFYEEVEIVNGYVRRSAGGRHANRLQQWSSKITDHCSGHFIGFSEYFVRLHHVVLDKRYGHVEAVGGGSLDLVKGQTISAEVYRLKILWTSEGSM